MPSSVLVVARPLKERALARSIAAMAGSALVLLGAVACSGSIDVRFGGSSGISGPALEEDISDRVIEISDVAPESVDCPESLDAKVGATATCEMVHEGVRVTLAIEATSLAEDGKTLDFSWTVEPGSQRLLTDRVGDTIADAFAATTGLTLTDLTCPEPELDGTAGTVMTCEAATASGASGPVILSVSGAEGMRINFSWRLGDSSEN